VTGPTRHRVGRFVAVVMLALAVTTISRLEAVATVGADAPPAPTQVAALLPDDAVPGTETVGVQPPRAPDVGRVGSVPSVRSVVLAVAAVTAGLAGVGVCRPSGRPAGDRLPVRSPLAWAGPGGRRAPPLARAARRPDGLTA
jgi:hypothetical protein